VEDPHPVTLLVDLAGGLLLDYAAFFVAAVMSTLLFAICVSSFSAFISSSKVWLSSDAASFMPSMHRPSGKRAVGGHLVVFDRLAGCDETGIDRRAFAEFFDRLLALCDDAIDRLAGLGLGRLPIISNTCSRRSIWPWFSSRCGVKAFFSSASFAPSPLWGESDRSSSPRSRSPSSAPERFRCDGHHAGWNTTFTQPSFLALKV
jgi:hypothetical protein